MNGIYYANTLKTYLWNAIQKKKTVLDRTVVSASRQSMATYYTVMTAVLADIS
jgi:uncharacterized membrane protein